MTTRPTAIWSAPTAYRSAARLGAHHLATRLAARGWDVIFLSNPLTPLHVLKCGHSDVRLRLSQAMRGLATEPEGLRTLLPMTLLPLVAGMGARSGWVLERWPAFTLPNLASTLRRAGFDEPDLMVVDTSIAAPLLDMLKPKRSVLRLTDRFGGFASTTPAVLRAMEAVARQVDLVIYTAEDLAADAEMLRSRRMLHLANGVDAGHFDGRRPVPAAYEAIPAPRAVYVGLMAEWFDFDLIARAARQRPDVAFVLIGPDEAARQRLPKLPNLHLIGPVPWNELPAYLQHAAVGLIPFDMKNHRDLVKGVNPLKLYEYAAAGVPVVSIAWPEIQKLNAPVELVDEPEEFLQAIDRMLQAPPPADTLRAFAARHDWSFVLDQFLAALDLSDAGNAGSPAWSDRGSDVSPMRSRTAAQ
jgi:glycosyltransferase involved in cell wall biosynthesis